MSNIIFIFSPKKIKRRIIFFALRVNKKFTFYCHKLSIETKKSQLHTLPHSTHFRCSNLKIKLTNICILEQEQFNLKRKITIN